MPNTADDISIVFSGGTNNTNPNLSIGGAPSSTPITDNQLNNLFDDVLPAESEAGHEDYRCFYVFNDGDEAVYNFEIWIESQVDDGASIEIGIKNKDELQRITLSGSLPTSGSGTFSYENEDFVVPVFSDLAEAAQHFEDSLNALVDGDGVKLLETTVVTTPSSLGSPTIIFDVLFTGNDGKKNHEQITLEEDNYLPEAVTWTTTTVQEGAPVNTVAPSVANDETPPDNVEFYVASEASPISVYRLLPEEGFPIWIKRVTTAGAVSKASDGATLKFRMETIEP